VTVPRQFEANNVDGISYYLDTTWAEALSDRRSFLCRIRMNAGSTAFVIRRTSPSGKYASSSAQDHLNGSQHAHAYGQIGPNGMRTHNFFTSNTLNPQPRPMNRLIDFCDVMLTLFSKLYRILRIFSIRSYFCARHFPSLTCTLHVAALLKISGMQGIIISC
jgi:hypothetical protein